eukprot:CAMPEP_0118984644 /NCGR_PEP_ID=MMETSP1173-20130426/38221_1 /TAXON_ID=1034831 /ORGANISM="Rhizochromulina marina cf, Strain CCMP1243" /LENGTH=279 /DNA_ID=CAMNT_0006935321 /DNA_START=54 /DNA_END=893 /DNA_ORIENTATION=-
MKLSLAAVLLVLPALSSGFGPRSSPLRHRTKVQWRRSPATPALVRMMSSPDDGGMSPGGFNTGGEAPIEIRGFSLAKATLGVGLGLTLASFAEFFVSDGSASLSSLGFIYGIPVTLIGCALQYAELEPAGLQTDEATEQVFETKATETMKKILQDVTRHRYGDEAHLDTTVKTLGLVLPQKKYPQLQYLTQARAEGGEVSLTCVFQSLDTPYRLWAEEDRVKKYDVFFGPGVWCDVIKVSSEEKLVGIKITTGDRPAAAAATEMMTEEAPAASSAAAAE